MRTTAKKIIVTLLATATIVCAVAIPGHFAMHKGTLYENPALDQLATFYHANY